MEAEKIGVFALESDQQRPKLVNPCERTFNREATFVNISIELPFPPSFHRFSTPFIFINIRDDTCVPKELPCSTRIKATIGIEIGAFHRQPNSLQPCEQLFQCLCQLIRVIMVARNNTSCRNNVSIRINEQKNVAGFSFLSSLIGYAFAPFLATLWLPSRCTSDTLSSPRAETMLASNRRWRLPSALHLRK